MSANDNLLIQAAAQVLVQVLTPILIMAGTALVGYCIQWVRSKLSGQQLTMITWVVGQFVLAAEQYNLGGLAVQSGEEKKEWVLSRAQAELARRGITIDLALLADIVEAEVLKSIPPSTPPTRGTVRAE